ncbi:hypothetical protein EG328_004222 [Venturia inaequalis]|uniref:Sushi domain-containing protein n=1 Tax=Venturia inaequalis TaxID=5025 RepID=A0A8H3UMX8_VENIN|nr:hypothetical protein EG328_004222 [Venturia inaequalis]
MKSCLAFSLILPFAYGQLHGPSSFLSAKEANPCAYLFDGGEGFGRVRMKTNTARCANKFIMNMECQYLNPWNGGTRLATYICPLDEECVNIDVTPPVLPDAGCLKLFSPQGTKGEGKESGYACSAGVTFPYPIHLVSVITPNNHQYDSSIASCSVVKSGTRNYIYRSSPCSKATSTIALLAKQTYQACIQVTAALRRTSVAFTWHLDSPGKTIRGLGNGTSLSEMVTVHGNSTDNDLFRIVIGGEEVRSGTGD